MQVHRGGTQLVCLHARGRRAVSRAPSARSERSPAALRSDRARARAGPARARLVQLPRARVEPQRADPARGRPRGGPGRQPRPEPARLSRRKRAQAGARLSRARDARPLARPRRSRRSRAPRGHRRRSGPRRARARRPAPGLHPLPVRAADDPRLAFLAGPRLRLRRGGACALRGGERRLLARRRVGRVPPRARARSGRRAARPHSEDVAALGRRHGVRGPRVPDVVPGLARLARRGPARFRGRDGVHARRPAAPLPGARAARRRRRRAGLARPGHLALRVGARANQDQLALAREVAPAGVALFSYDALAEKPETLATLGRP